MQSQLVERLHTKEEEDEEEEEEEEGWKRANDRKRDTAGKDGEERRSISRRGREMTLGRNERTKTQGERASEPGGVKLQDLSASYRY